MEPCDYQDAGIFGGWTPFGPRKECIEKFSDGKRQTQTLYSNQDYWVYKEISVKAKHRKHHRTTAFGITIASWWASKKTDEVALVVHDATFEITKPNQVASTPDFTVPSTPVNSRMTFYTEGYMIHGSGAPSGVAFTISQDRYPSTPFDEDVIVQFYNDYVSLNQSMDITVDDVSDIFWDQVYDQVRQTYHSYKGRDPKTITMLMATPQSTIVHYVDLRRRETNVRKVKDILAYDWGAKIEFTVSLDATGQAVSNPDAIAQDPFNPDNQEIPTTSTIAWDVKVKAGKLTNFDKIRLDFTGVSRRNNEWRGSEMVYGSN